MKTTQIDLLLKECEAHPFEPIGKSGFSLNPKLLGLEILYVLSERNAFRSYAKSAEMSRDEWKAKAQELEEQLMKSKEQIPQSSEPPSYKGVTYQAGMWRKGDLAHNNVFHSLSLFFNAPTDTDYAELLKLRDVAERQPTLEGVVREWYGDWINSNPTSVKDIENLCARLRAVFPHLDAGGPVAC